jgi:hypothetical protein
MSRSIRVSPRPNELSATAMYMFAAGTTAGSASPLSDYC